MNLSLLSKYRSALMGFAILWVISFHLPKPRIPLLSEFLSLGYGGVDMFLFLSGFGLYFSMSKPVRSVTSFYKQRFNRIIPEFWLFLLVTFLVAGDFQSSSFEALLWKASTVGYWVQAPYSLWYLSCIVLFYACFPLYYRLLQKYGLKVSLWGIGLGLLLMIVYAVVMVYGYHNRNVGGNLVLSVARIPIFIIGSVFGYLVKNQVPIVLTRIQKMCLALVAVASFLLLFYVSQFLQAYAWTCSLLFFPFIFITPVACFALASLLDRMPQRVVGWLAWVGSISLELYIVHEYLYEQYTRLFSDHYSFPFILACVLVSIPVAAVALKFCQDRILSRISQSGNRCKG